MLPTPVGYDTLTLYEKQAEFFDANRDRSLYEKHWLGRFTGHLAPNASILDLGCGVGDPIAAHFINKGFVLTGVDGAKAMIDKCAARFPEHEWIKADMRGLTLNRDFAGIIAWNSFFHLTQDEQRAMFPVFSSHARPGAPLLFTSGTGDGEVWGKVGDEPVYHASLAPAEYRLLLQENGWEVLDHLAEDPECAGHTIWLARKTG